MEGVIQRLGASADLLPELAALSVEELRAIVRYLINSREPERAVPEVPIDPTLRRMHFIVAAQLLSLAPALLLAPRRVVRMLGFTPVQNAGPIRVLGTVTGALGAHYYMEAANNAAEVMSASVYARVAVSALLALLMKVHRVGRPLLLFGILGLIGAVAQSRRLILRPRL